MSSLQVHARSRVRITVVLGRGRHAAEAMRVHRGSIEGDARQALRCWRERSEERFSEQFGSDLGRSVGALIFFDREEDRAAALAELDSALDRCLLERLHTRANGPASS